MARPVWNQQAATKGPPDGGGWGADAGWSSSWNASRSSAPWNSGAAPQKRLVPTASADGQGKSKIPRSAEPPPSGGVGEQMRRGLGEPATAGSPGSAATRASMIGSQAAGGAAASSAGAGKATAKLQTAEQPVFKVFCSDNSLDMVAIRTLVGNFYEKEEESHGRKVYQKVGSEDVDVLLYYWDDRDGDDFLGWWFGNQVGGSKVWAHCMSSDDEPPGFGWKIPWDGDVRPGLSIERIISEDDIQIGGPHVSMNVQKYLSEDLPSAEDLRQMQVDKELEELSNEVMEKEAEAKEVLNQARAVVPADMDAEVAASEVLNLCGEAAKLIVPRVTMIADLGRKVSGFVKTASGDEASRLKDMSQQLRFVHEDLNVELRRIHELHVKVSEQVRAQEVEDRDIVAFAEILPEATEKSHTAEDLVQTAAIIAEMISENAEDQEQVRISLAQTEQAVKKASMAICEARILLSSKLGVVGKFTERIREDATWQLSRQQLQLKEALEKLAPLKTVRQDFEQKHKAQQVLDEVSRKVALAEVDMDKAEELILMLDSEESVNQEALEFAKVALKEAEQHVGRAFADAQSQRSSATGLVLEALDQMTPRSDQAKARLKRLDGLVKEAIVKTKTSAVLGEAAEKMAEVTDALMALDGIEHQLEAIGDSSLQDVLSLAAEADAAAAGTQSSTSMARMFIQMKALEVKRLTGKTGQQAAEQLREFTREIDAASKRLAEIKASVSRKKRLALLNAAKDQVISIEEHLELVKQAAAIFADDAQLVLLSPDEIREISEKAEADEKQTAEMIDEARKVVMARQIEAKGKDASPEISAELLKLHSRISTAQAELGKQRKMFGSIEVTLASREQLNGMEDKLKAMEDKVAKASNAMSSVGKEPSEALHSEKPSKDSDGSFADATLAVRTMSRYLESQMRTPQGSARAARCNLEKRVKEAQEQLDASILAMRENAEKQNVRNLLSECRAKIAECEDALEKADEAACAALEGGKAHNFEQLAQAAHHAATNAKVLLKMKGLVVKRLSESAAKPTSEALLEMQGTVDEAAKKLVEMRSRHTEWKKSQRSA